jgi:hypothetical protein
MTGTHFPDRKGLGSGRMAIGHIYERLDCALVHIFLVRFGRYNDPDGHPFVAKFDRDRDTTGEAERIGENEITPSEPPFPARR